MEWATPRPARGRQQDGAALFQLGRECVNGVGHGRATGFGDPHPAQADGCAWQREKGPFCVVLKSTGKGPFPPGFKSSIIITVPERGEATRWMIGRKGSEE